MTDRTAAEVMCCPEGCEKDAIRRLRGECHASAFVRLTESIHAAGFMIVPRVPTDAMKVIGGVETERQMFETDNGLIFDAAASIYRAMTEAGELK